MKVFLSWSGSLSQSVAATLHKYFPVMLQGLEAFMSKHDVESGTRWSFELARELESSSFGVLCLTAENLHSPWLLFEAGALTKHVEGRACGLLLGQLKPTDVSGPLSQFQHRTFSREDLAALLRDINAKLAKPLDASQLTLIFEKWWPDLEREYQVSLESAVDKKQPTLRDQRDLLEEMLSRIRIIERVVQDRFSSPTLRDYLEQAFALLTNRQKQVLREIAKANEAGERIPLDRFSPEDLEDVKRWVSQSEDGLAIIHKVVGEYLTRDSS